MAGTLIKNNKYAGFKYNIEKKYEAGIVLLGVDVKSIRANKFEIRDSVVKEEGGELFIWNIIFAENLTNKIQKRKLLLKRKEIQKISSMLKDKTKRGFVLTVRYNEKNKVKFDIGIGTTKKAMDKKASQKRSTDKRTFEKTIKDIV